MLSSMQNRLARIASVRSMLLAALCVATALALSSALGAAASARDRWGVQAPVILVTKRVEPGQALDGSNTTATRWPMPLVPDGSAAALPPEARANDRLYPGQPLLGEQMLGEGGTLPIAAAGQVALPIPRGPAVVDAAPGDKVQLLVRSVPGLGSDVGPAAAGPSAAEPPALVRGTVVAADEERLTIAEGKDEAILVGQAVMSSAVGVMFEQAG